MTGTLSRRRGITRLCAALAIAGAFPAADAWAETPPGAAARINTVREISLVAAQRLVANGLDHAAAAEMKLAIAVVDRAGDLLAFARMDGASIVTVDVAIGKARTAAFLKGPSKRFEDMINAGRPSMATAPGLLPLQGGMPILHEGEVVGAVGVSGSSGDNDQIVATLIADSLAQAAPGD